MKSTKQRDIKNLKDAVAYNEAHVEDHKQHLAKMLRKKKHVEKIPLQKVSVK